MTDDELQKCLEAGDLPGTPSESRAIRRAFALGRRCALAEVVAELAVMDCSLSARDAAVDFRQSYESELATP